MADETLRYDALVIGAGAGGLSAAALLAHHGYRTLLVEGRDRVGGRASSVREEGFTVNTGAIALEYGGLLEETFQTVGARFEIRVPEPAAMFRINHRNVDISSGGWGMLINGITKKGAGVDSGARGTGTCPRSSSRPGTGSRATPTTGRSMRSSATSARRSSP